MTAPRPRAPVVERRNLGGVNLRDLLAPKRCSCGTCARCQAAKLLAELEAQVAEAHRQEVARQDLAWWALTYSDRERFRGVIVVRAFGPLDAQRDAYWRGETGLPTASVRLGEDPPPSAVGRLLTADEIRTYFGDAIRVP